jgi:DNA-binding MarR family transcriptional regulator
MAVDDALADAAAALRELILAGERYRRAASNYLGLDLSQTQAVSYLYSRGDIGQSDLGALLGYNTSSITALVDRLERDGIARRQPHPTDRRRTVVTLNEHGHDAVATTRQWFLRAFDHIDPQTLPDVTAALSVIAADLGLQTADLASDAKTRLSNANSGP